MARAVAVASLLLGARYLMWRTTTLQGTGIAGLALGFAEFLNYFFTFLGVVVYWRVKRRMGPPRGPEGSLDVFIPVCGEPVEVVERTLRAALNIDYPHSTYLLNDGRIANKPQWNEIVALANRYGIQCFTRTEGARRKAGNLNHALGNTSGELIAVIDADHTARIDFAHQLLGYFKDPRVAYVSTAQFFETPAGDIFGNKEELFYHYIQPAKDAANSAISCGNGVVYRRKALEDIGGFSEWNIVEDLHTSYQLHSSGWKSVYHPRPVTRGLAPLTGVEVLRQRLGWATDSLRLILWDNPLWKSGLTLRQRLNYLHLGGFYLVMVAQLMFFIAPALVLVWDVPLIRSESAWAYVGYASPYFFLQFLYLVLTGGLRGGLRSVQKGIYLAPTYLLATLRALTGINFSSPVTEKRQQKTISWILVPQLLLFVLLIYSITQALLHPSWAGAVAAVWAAWIASALAIPLSTVGVRSWCHKYLRNFAQASVAGAAAVTAFLAFSTSGLPSDQQPALATMSSNDKGSNEMVISGITQHVPAEIVTGDSATPLAEVLRSRSVTLQEGAPPVRHPATDGPAWSERRFDVEPAEGTNETELMESSPKTAAEFQQSGLDERQDEPFVSPGAPTTRIGGNTASLE